MAATIAPSKLDVSLGNFKCFGCGLSVKLLNSLNGGSCSP